MPKLATNLELLETKIKQLIQQNKTLIQTCQKLQARIKQLEEPLVQNPESTKVQDLKKQLNRHTQEIEKCIQWLSNT